MPEISLQQLSLENPDTVVLSRREWQELLDCSIALDSAIRNDCHHGGPDAELMVAVNCRLQCFVCPVQKRLDEWDDLRADQEGRDDDEPSPAPSTQGKASRDAKAGCRGAGASQAPPRSRSCPSNPNS